MGISSLQKVLRDEGYGLDFMGVFSKTKLRLGQIARAAFTPDLTHPLPASLADWRSILRSPRVCVLRSVQDLRNGIDCCSAHPVSSEKGRCGVVVRSLVHFWLLTLIDGTDLMIWVNG